MYIRKELSKISVFPKHESSMSFPCNSIIAPTTTNMIRHIIVNKYKLKEDASIAVSIKIVFSSKINFLRII